LAWHRDHIEQSDAWVTLARIDLLRGNRAAASHATDEAAHLWPHNPRLSLLADIEGTS